MKLGLFGAATLLLLALKLVGVANYDWWIIGIPAMVWLGVKTFATALYALLVWAEAKERRVRK